MDFQTSPLPDAYDMTQPTRPVLDRIGDKWTVLLIGRLEQGPLRFTALRRSLRGLSQKVLTQALRGLERDGLVHRKVLCERPPKVEYALSPLGRTLTEVLAAIRAWSERHIVEVQAAQVAFDARRAPADLPRA